MSIAASESAEAIRASAAAGPKARADFHIPSLDGLRAAAFMFVFLAHAGLWEWVPGAFGVTIFFFLSGYLITTLLRLEREQTGRNGLRDFYVRRVFRILPPFYTVLALASVLTLVGLLPPGLRISSLLAQVGHFANYWIVFRGDEGFPAGTIVYWSLAVEEHFYLLFPWLFIFLQRSLAAKRREQAAILLAICAAVLVWRLVLVFLFDASDRRTSLCSDTRLDSILFGCVLALWGNPVLDPWRGSRALWTRVLLPLGCGLLAVTFAYRAPWFRETLRYSLQGIGLFPVFVVAIRYPDWGPMRVLNWRPVRHIGLLSYSLYLCHQVILVVVMEKLLPGVSLLIIGPVTLALSLVLATVIRHLVELPSARARKAFLRSPLQPAASVEVTSPTSSARAAP